jgi:hypothetical protein
VPKKSECNFLVVLDACVLVPAALRDTLLRFAEDLGSTYPMVGRNHLGNGSHVGKRNRFGAGENRASRIRVEETLRRRVGIRLRTIAHPLTNHPKDRHVVAAAIRCVAQVIVTYNRRHFPQAAVEPWGVEVQGPTTFLKQQCDLNPEVVIDKLPRTAANLGRSLPELLRVLKQAVPGFVAHVTNDLGIDIEK